MHIVFSILICPTAAANLGNLLSDPQCLQDFWRGLLDCEQLVADVAVLSNRLAAFCCVRAVVTSEATGRVSMAQVIRVGAPSHLEFREDVASVDCLNGPCRTVYCLRLRGINRRIRLPVKTSDC